MKKTLLSIFNHEVFKYLVGGVLTTLVYCLIRIGLYFPLHDAVLVAAIANLLAILFAFWINDTYVFEQKRQGWLKRFISFFLARLSTMVLDSGLAFLLVDKYPSLIGQFVHNNLDIVNIIATLIGQVLIMVTNYFISKLLIFKDKK